MAWKIDAESREARAPPIDEGPIIGAAYDADEPAAALC